MKNNKGITLIALIITIVVLIILAVVAISSIEDTDLLTRANNATTKWNESVKNEKNELNNYVDIIDIYGCEHIFDWDVCKICGYRCEHRDCEKVYDVEDENWHYIEMHCNECSFEEYRFIYTLF